MSGAGSSGFDNGTAPPANTANIHALSEADLALFAQLGIPLDNTSNDDVFGFGELGADGEEDRLGNWNPDDLNYYYNHNAASLGDYGGASTLQSTEDLLAALNSSQLLSANGNAVTNGVAAALGGVEDSDAKIAGHGPQQLLQFGKTANGGGPSNLSNNPPRFFPLPPSVAAMAAGASPLLLRSSLASKPPVLRKACNFCTRRRRRCDGLMPTCGACAGRGLVCVYEANKKMLQRTPYPENSLSSATPSGGRRRGDSQSYSSLHPPGATLVQPTFSNPPLVGGPGAAGAVRHASNLPIIPPMSFASAPIASSLQTAQTALDSYFVPFSSTSAVVQPTAQLFADSDIARTRNNSTFTSGPMPNFFPPQQPQLADPDNITDVTSVDPLFEVLAQSQEAMLAVRRVAREFSRQSLITEVTTEEGLRQAFIIHVVPRMPAYLRTWFFTGVTRDSEFGEYLMDPSTPSLSFAEPSIYLPLVAGCKKLLLKHITLPSFLPSLVHIILYATILCNMAVDPNGELGLGDVDCGPAPEWSPLANSKTAKEVDSLLRICIGLSLRMGINKEPTTRLTTGEQPKVGNNKEGGSLRSEVELLDGILLMDGAGASMNTDRQDMIRKIWWLQYMTDRMTSFLMFRKPSIDDAECNIFPPSLAAEMAGNGITSPQSDGSLDVDDLEAKVSDLHLHTLSLLGRAVQYRIACVAFKADPLAVDDPQRQSLETDLLIFRGNLPSLIRTFDLTNIPAREAASISTVSHELLQHLVFDALTLNSATILLNSPSQLADPHSVATWVDSPAAISMGEAGMSTARLIVNAIWAPSFTRGQKSTPITGLAQADVFVACMALAMLVRRLQVGIVPFYSFQLRFSSLCPFLPSIPSLQQDKYQGSTKDFEVVFAPIGTLGRRYELDSLPGDKRAPVDDMNPRVRARKYLDGIQLLLDALEWFKMGPGGWLSERATGLLEDVIEGIKEPCPIELAGKAWSSGEW